MVARWSSLLLVVVLSAAGCQFHSSGDESAPADFTVAVPKAAAFIVGEANASPRPVVSIEIRNTSSNPLTLSLVSKSCNCFDVRLPNRPIAGNQRVTVAMIGPSGAGIRRIGFTLAGTVEGSAAVQKSVKTILSVYPDQEVAPRAILRTIRRSHSEPIVLTYRRYTREPNPQPDGHKVVASQFPSFLTLDSIRWLGRRLIVDNVTAMEWEIKWRCRDKAEGALDRARHGQLKIAYDGLPPLEVPFHFSCGDEISVSPEVIYFDATPVGGHADRYAIVQIGGSEAVSIPQVRSSQPDFSVESMESLTPTAPDGPRMLRIKLRFAPASPGIRRSEITVSFSTPERREARIVTTGRGV